MLHIVIVQNPKMFQLIISQTTAKKIPLDNLSYDVYSQGNIRVVGECKASSQETLVSIMTEFNPDTIFFVSESYPVSDEKLPGDIILPNVLFPYNNEIETTEITKDMVIPSASQPIFLEHYPLQGDYNFETFGLSVGWIHVSGDWNTEIEDFRIRLRVVYENDTFDPYLYDFIKTSQVQWIQEKAYPVAYIWTQDITVDARNLWSIVGFVIGSIDVDLVSTEEEDSNGTTEEEEGWVDGSEEI